MDFNFSLRKFAGCLADVEICYNNTRINIYPMDNEQAKVFLETLKNAVDDVEWFVNSTEK